MSEDHLSLTGLKFYYPHLAVVDFRGREFFTRASVAYVQEGEQIRASFAFVSPRDTFNRKRARAISGNRLQSGDEKHYYSAALDPAGISATLDKMLESLVPGTIDSETGKLRLRNESRPGTPCKSYPHSWCKLKVVRPEYVMAMENYSREIQASFR